ISQVETTTGLMGEAIMDYMMNGRVWGPQGNRHPTMAPHGNYPCQGNDRWVSIAVDTEAEWQGLCRAMGNPPWTEEERFADKFGRLTHQEELDKRIGEWTKDHTPYQVMEILQRSGVAAAPVLNLDQRCADPQLKAREDWIEIEHPVAGKEPFYGLSWKLTDTPGRIRGNAPLLGEHNSYVFNGLLGLDEGEMKSLAEEKVIH
ncbi:MAG: CoA transferase, partial [Chloroflexota bacterium]|nr:CoA transferase [Chloroflexota bacterium]